MKESIYNLKISIKNKNYIYNLVSGEYILESELTDSNPSFYVDNTINEFQKIVEYTNELRKNSKFMVLTIMLTNDCNFSCEYCFENSNTDYLTDDSIVKIQDIIINHLTTHPHIDDLVVFWFGGEPLLCIDLIRKFNNVFVNLTECYNVRYSSRLITNGYYVDKIIEYIDELKLTDIQITIDGLETTHDSRRITKSKKGSFSKIINNIMLINKEVNLIIRVNIDRGNIDEVAELYDFICQLKLHSDVNLIFYPALVEDYGGLSSTYSECISTDLDLLDDYLLIQEKTNTLDSISFIQSFCNVGFSGCMVISCKKDLFKCWGEIEDKTKSFSSLSSTTDEICFKLEHSPFKVKSERCKICKFFPLCMSGCELKPFTLSHCRWLEKKAINTIKLNLERTLL